MTIDLGSAIGLTCRECGATYDLGAAYACIECFGPLEVAYDFPAITRADIESGPSSLWRYKDLLPVRPTAAAEPNLAPGWTRLHKADNLAAELGHAQPVGEGRLRQPHPLLQGPGRGRRTVGRAGPGPHHPGLRVHRQPRPRRRGRCRPGRAGIGRGHPARPRSRQDHHDGHVRRHPAGRRGQLRRRQPVVFRDHRRGLLPNLGLRQRQHPSVLRRGLEVDGLRDRRATGLADSGPGRRPGRVRVPADQGGQGVAGTGRTRSHRRNALRRLRAHRRRVVPRSPRHSTPVGTS